MKTVSSTERKMVMAALKRMAVTAQRKSVFSVEIRGVHLDLSGVDKKTNVRRGVSEFNRAAIILKTSRTGFLDLATTVARNVSILAQTVHSWVGKLVGVCLSSSTFPIRHRGQPAPLA
jgi:hypothetical protein